MLDKQPGGVESRYLVTMTKRNAVLGEICRLENISPNKEIAKPRKEKLANDIINLAKFKHCKDFEKVDRIATGIKKKYRSLRNAHREFGSLTWKRWHSICKPKKILHVMRRVTEKRKTTNSGFV